MLFSAILAIEEWDISMAPLTKAALRQRCLGLTIQRWLLPRHRADPRPDGDSDRVLLVPGTASGTGTNNAGYSHR